MGMNARKRIYLGINPADRVRPLASATAYAAGRRTYVVGAVPDALVDEAGRLYETSDGEAAAGGTGGRGLTRTGASGPTME